MTVRHPLSCKPHDLMLSVSMLGGLQRTHSRLISRARLKRSSRLWHDAAGAMEEQLAGTY